MAHVRLVVALIRLSRIRCFWALVHRLAAMDSPARLTTAPAPSTSAAQGPASPLGHHATNLVRVAFVLGTVPRVRMTRSWPSAPNADASARPRNPVPPAMTTRIYVSGGLSPPRTPLRVRSRGPHNPRSAPAGRAPGAP